MRVKLLRDYLYYRKGDVVELSDEIARELVFDKHATWPSLMDDPPDNKAFIGERAKQAKKKRPNS